MKKRSWQDCAEFHGHECPGLMMGYKAALYAIELLGVEFSGDEDVVCISENDACSVDAIQVMLGCTAGKGNLLFHLRGKQAYSFYDRKNGRSVRIVLKNRPEGRDKKEVLEKMSAMEPKDMFEVKKTVIELPEEARIFKSIVCENCGEAASENMIRLKNGKMLCLDCAGEYSRYDV